MEILENMGEPFRFQGAGLLDLLPATKCRYALFVAGLGIEPKFSLSESDVLPLDDPAMLFSCRLKLPYSRPKMKFLLCAGISNETTFLARITKTGTVY